MKKLLLVLMLALAFFAAIIGGTLWLMSDKDSQDASNTAYPEVAMVVADSTMAVSDQSEDAETEPKIQRTDSVCLYQEYLNADEEQQAVEVICSNMPSGGAHVESGLVTIYYFQHDSSTGPIAKQKGIIESGSYGHVGDISTMAIGKGRIAVLVEDSYMGQGYINNTARLFAFFDGEVKEVAQWESHTDNHGAVDCEETPNPCQSMDRVVVPDTTDPNQDFYPLHATITRENGNSTQQEKQVYLFLANQMRYNIPEDAENSP